MWSSSVYQVVVRCPLLPAGALVGRDLFVHGRVVIRQAVHVLVPPQLEQVEAAGSVNHQVGWAALLVHRGMVPQLQFAGVPDNQRLGIIFPQQVPAQCEVGQHPLPTRTDAEFGGARLAVGLVVQDSAERWFDANIAAVVVRQDHGGQREQTDQQQQSHGDRADS